MNINLYKAISLAIAMIIYIILPLQIIGRDKDKDIHGTVVDESGEPLVGVSVFQHGTTRGTSTDIYGNFTLSVTGDAPVLTFSCIGFHEVEKKVADTSIEIRVILIEDRELINESQVIGYEVVKKSDLSV